jgi:general stress protein YciG
MPRGNRNADRNLSREDRQKGGSMSPGNFKNDREKASEAGRIGGQN